MIEIENVKEEIFEYLRNIIAEKAGLDDAEEIRLESNLITDVGLDSVGILQIILDVENEYKIKIDNDELDGEIFSKFGNFVKLVARKTNEAL